MPGVADVRYDRQWLDRLLAAMRVIRGVGLALGAILTIAAALTVANVVRLGLYARRDELDIMQLVGAPQVYIRGSNTSSPKRLHNMATYCCLTGQPSGWSAGRPRTRSRRRSRA